MAGIRDLETLLAAMEPELVPGEFVFVSLPGPVSDLADLPALAMVREPEGVSYVVERATADVRGWEYDFIGAWITLRVHSALDAVGLTAAVSAALAEVRVSCNVIAGRHHDHLLVPIDATGLALDTLRRLSATAAAGAGHQMMPRE